MNSRAVLYCRVSTSSQEDGSSLASQFIACQRKADEIGATVVAHLEEIESGGLYLARPKMQQALAMLESGEADTLIIYRLDRTGRDVDGLRAIRRRVREAGGNLVFADGMQFDRTPTGNLMFTQLGAFAEFERETIRDRTMRGLRSMAKAGKQPARTKPAYGYHVVLKSDVVRGTYPAGSEGDYIVKDDEAAVVRTIFEQYVSGHSLRSLCGWLIDNHYPAPKGGLWKPATIRAIITRTHYKGIGTYGKRRHRVDESRLSKGKRIRYAVPAPPEDVVTFPVPPIVDADLWQRANERLASGNATRSGPTSKYLLTGFVFCPKCGRRMYAMKTHDSGPQPHTFGCSASFPVHKGHAPGCERRRYSGPVLEKLVAWTLHYLLTTPAATQALYDYSASAKHRNRQNRATGEITRLTAEIERLSKREAAAADAVIEARMKGSDGAAYERARHTAETKRHELEARLKELEAQIENEEVTDWLTPEAAAALVSELHELGLSTGILQSAVQRIYPLPAEEGQKRRNYNTQGVTIVLNYGSALCVVAQGEIASRAAKEIDAIRVKVSVRDTPPYPLPPPDKRRVSRA